jgi:hypothetical protein
VGGGRQLAAERREQAALHTGTPPEYDLGTPAYPIDSLVTADPHDLGQHPDCGACLRC